VKHPSLSISVFDIDINIKCLSHLPFFQFRHNIHEDVVEEGVLGTALGKDVGAS
jgi:hypothetical protein